MEFRDAETYHHRLMYFPAEAVSDREPGLLDLVFEIFPVLASDDLWGGVRSQNVAAYWVWQIPETQSLEVLLHSMVDRFPDEGNWAYYLGELYDRRGQREQAETYYQRAIALSADGLPIERRQAGSSSHLADDEDQLRGRVASLLGLRTTQVDLGANAVSDPFVLNDGRLAADWSLAVNHSTSYWQYAGEQDAFEQLGSMRITDLWWPLGNHETGTDPFAQFETSIALPSGTNMMISIWYRVDSSSTAKGQVFLGTEANAFAFVDLPNYDGRLTQMIAIGAAPKAGKQRLILRNLGAASIWFNKVEVRPIDVGGLATRCRKEICTQFFQLTWALVINLSMCKVSD